GTTSQPRRRHTLSVGRSPSQQQSCTLDLVLCREILVILVILVIHRAGPGGIDHRCSRLFHLLPIATADPRPPLALRNAANKPGANKCVSPSSSRASTVAPCCNSASIDLLELLYAADARGVKPSSFLLSSMSAPASTRASTTPA
ncbi:unnamed protein product, partial [Ectocarpus sp. 8 AP-2014]